jgi:hypothetical protein
MANDVLDDTLVEREILDAVRGIRFGSVEIVIHDARVVQVIRTEKKRFDEGTQSRSAGYRTKV